MLKKALLVSMILVFALVITMSSSVMAQEKYDVAYIARAQGDSFAAWLANSIVNEAENYENINIEVFDDQASDSKQNS